MEYLVGNIVELNKPIQLYTVFSLFEDASSVDTDIIGNMEDTDGEFNNGFSTELDSELDDKLDVSNANPLTE